MNMNAVGIDVSKRKSMVAIIRPGGEKRLSGFMLYLSSYAEIGFYDTLWPDWNPEMMDTVIADYQARNRRFGGL